jgi:hypothetical protein
MSNTLLFSNMRLDFYLSLAKFCLLDTVGKEAEQRYIFHGTLFSPFRKGTSTRVPDSQYRSLEEMHHSLLLIKISLICQVIEGKYWVVSIKHSPHKWCSIKIMLP